LGQLAEAHVFCHDDSALTATVVDLALALNDGEGFCHRQIGGFEGQDGGIGAFGCGYGFQWDGGQGSVPLADGLQMIVRLL